MNSYNIIRMAREAGLINSYDGRECASDELLVRFYHLARAAGEQAERDRTKRLVEDMQNELRQRRIAGRDT